jgi:hypothetical protein
MHRCAHCHLRRDTAIAYGATRRQCRGDRTTTAPSRSALFARAAIVVIDGRIGHRSMTRHHAIAHRIRTPSHQNITMLV